jgi:hypothetical protein
MPITALSAHDTAPCRPTASDGAWSIATSAAAALQDIGKSRPSRLPPGRSLGGPGRALAPGSTARGGAIMVAMPTRERVPERQFLARLRIALGGWLARCDAHWPRSAMQQRHGAFQKGKQDGSV